MKNNKYTLGLDFGTLSVRCVIADEHGKDIGEASFDYPHGVMDTTLPSGVKLPPRFALQYPEDYIVSARTAIKEALEASGVSKSDIVGMGIDFTTCTMLAVDENLTPLCHTERFRDEPHAYCKLWKHYGATEEAAIITKLAKDRGEGWLKTYGGYVSPEWMLPKIYETLRRAPEVYDATYRFVEAGDWLTWLITENESHGVAFAGFKSLWNEETGYPSNDFMTAISPKLSGIVGTKISEKIINTAECAGYLTKRGAELLGLSEGTAVASAFIDAHAALPAVGLSDEGELLMIVGTSGIQLINTPEKKGFEGCLGCVKNAYLPDMYTYENGQAAVGDIFAWFVKNCVPASYEKEAAELGISVHKLLRERAKALEVGESGLIALDWHNGNRSPLTDPKLSSMMLGMHLGTRPEEMYRAWLEASAYGTRSIIENLEKNGIPVRRIIASGGIALKDELFMQILADVFGKEVEVSSSTQAAAHGSAALAAVAAGIYPDVSSAAKAFAVPIHKIYKPIPENHEKYTKLYNEYVILQDYFAKGGNDVMKRLMKK